MANPEVEELEQQLSSLENVRSAADSSGSALALQRDIDGLNGRWLRAVMERSRSRPAGTESVRLALLDIGARSHPDAVVAALDRVGRFDGPVNSRRLPGRETIQLISNWIDETDRRIISAGRSPGSEATRGYVDAKYEVLECLRPVFETVRDLRFETGAEEPRPATRRRWPTSVGAVVAVLVLLGLIVVLRNGGSNGESVSAASDQSTGESGAQVGASPSDSVPAVTDPIVSESSAAECQAARDVFASGSTSMRLSSPDLPGTIPETFWREFGYDAGFPTPAFEWSDIPDLTTELALLIAEVPPHEIVNVEDPNRSHGDGLPDLNPRWTAVGIDPASVGIGRTDVDGGLPAGVVEVGDEGVFVSLGDEWTRSKFVGPALPGETYLFGLFALCDPMTGEPDDFNPEWLHRWAIDYAYFTAVSAR